MSKIVSQFFPQKNEGFLKRYVLSLLAGLCLPLGFAPFHWPIFIYAGLALFYHQVLTRPAPFWTGLCFGVGFFGFGVSWVWNSIHEFGHLNYGLSFLITSALVLYLSVYTALSALALKNLARISNVWPPLVFACVWILFEFLRAHIMGGFPWLLLGFSQIDTPLANWIPVLGVYGIGFIAVLVSGILAEIFQTYGFARMKRQTALIAFFLIPMLLPLTEWSTLDKKPLSVAVIQSNLSMRDKWDENLYLQILTQYQEAIRQLLPSSLVVLPESAIPLPAQYVAGYLEEIHKQAKQVGSSILFGIPQTIPQNSVNVYYNTLQVIGRGFGLYQKQHLVPFGEYVPAFFSFLNQWGPLQSANFQSGDQNQSLPVAQKKPFAALICYELAFGEILRHQLPMAQWIVSISDDGWFGRSLAPYQQQQMAQVRSLQTARYQIMANNDGLSAVIDNKGKIIDSLPAFRSGLLQSEITPITGITPWVRLGDWPTIFLITGLLGYIVLRSLKNLINHKKSQ